MQANNLPVQIGYPYRMRAKIAALYVGESESAFRKNAGEKWPQGRKDGKNVYWYKDELERVMDDMRDTANDDFFGID
ncbi:hypothetical protein [Curvivirga aplysinae]|uniref:hypothetical protein n=1 Tax=Curvivirga aplysinae TaxID=2529852 RepID=UPI0012BD62F6|nr:hypothetical protein [Curvivirga aplysinae]MTI10507.1 hypothetical protein [Curvivirga aplysinae]